MIVIFYGLSMSSVGPVPHSAQYFVSTYNFGIPSGSDCYIIVKYSDSKSSSQASYLSEQAHYLTIEI